MLNVESTPAVVVVESAPLWVVADMVQNGRYQAVIVLSEDDEVLGLIRRDAVMRLAPRLPEAPVRMLPLLRALEIDPRTSSDEARQVFATTEAEALLIEKPMMQGWVVILREALDEQQREVA